MFSPSEKRASRGDIGGRVAGGALLPWAVLLLFPASPVATGSAGGVARAVVCLWHLLNVYLWLVPGWRRHVIERRGPLLGVGFAFGAAVVGAVADAFSLGATTAALTGAWRLLLYALPFVATILLRLPFRPHPLDLGVFALAACLPLVPGFDRPWVTLSPAAGSGGLLSAGLGAGSLGGAALLWTYVSGTRFWTLAPCDLKPREGDGRSLLSAWAAGTAAALAAGAVLFGTLLANPLAADPSAGGLWGWLEWALAGPGFAALVEVLIFRVLLQSWLAKALTGRVGLSPGRAHAAAAVVTAALHAAYGPFGLGRAVGFFVSLVHGLACARSNRLFPAAAAYALILLTLAALGAVLP